MASRRTAAIGATVLVALAWLTACKTDESAPLPDRLAAVDWPKFLGHCPFESQGLGMKIDGIVKADVTGDRAPDTIIIDSCESTTASNAQTVEIFDGSSDPAAPTRLGILLEGDPDYPRRVSVRVDPDRTIVIEAKGLQDGSPRCCPDLAIVAAYAWRDGTFVTLSRKNTPI
ncbi:MAG TPA: hypothetical protein DGT23_28785 [Micromonosporaceae bacterium]|nr:hypothetical protein [Micromonosporaceae bacterium]